MKTPLQRQLDECVATPGGPPGVIVADEPLRFRPGSQDRYSGTVAVALTAEAAAQWPYGERLRRIVWRRLGLRDTSLPLGYEIPEPYMRAYAVEPPVPPEDVSEAPGASGVWASGGIVSTPRDMTRFVNGHPRLRHRTADVAGGSARAASLERGRRASTVPAVARRGPGPPRRRAGARECAASPYPSRRQALERDVVPNPHPPFEAAPYAGCTHGAAGVRGAETASPECG
ncbi:serine hydrolase [Streptomyces sp. NPDC092370]|uniref:serine hydrolase n=1 Tax=Streptomyces sp. NPDC092370 TaxID=3366016 RepID=UPI0037F6B25D